MERDSKGKFVRGHFGYKANLGKSPSEEIRLKISNTLKGKMVGEKHPNWKGSRKRRNGYVMVKLSSHPFADVDGYVWKHRLVMEERLGRYLQPNEVIHHINGVTNDNYIENLRLYFSHSEHVKQHPNQRDSNGRFISNYGNEGL